MGGRSGESSNKGKWRGKKQGKYSGKKLLREEIKFDKKGKTDKK